MKRIPTIVLTVLFCLLFSVMSFAENIYIIDDDDDFVPQTTTAPAATTAEQTTASSDSGFGSLIGDGEALDGYLGDLSDKIGSGLDSVLSGLGDSLNQWDGAQVVIGNGSGESTTVLPSASAGASSSKPSYSVSITAAATTAPQTTEPTTAAAAENTTRKETELASVLVVNQASDGSQGLSGGTLTLVVFIAALVILVLVAIIALVLMTRRTEYNSAVMNKSTIPSVDQPKTLSQFMNDDIGDDGFDYGNITYWDDN